VRDLTEQEFSDQLTDLASSLRRDIEAKANGLDPAPEKIRERRRRVLVDKDFWFFATTYMPHHVWGEPSKFQKHFSQRFPQLLDEKSGCREWWVAPRGECKSTLLTKIGPSYIVALGLLQNPDVRAELDVTETPPFLDYLLFLGAETRMPTKLLEVTKTELTCNANLAMDFPEICGKGHPWRVGDAVTRNGVKLEPFGAEQAVRGTFHGSVRPKVLFGDDLITDKEAKSPTERENRWSWVEKAVDYLGPPDGSVKYLGVGTILNTDDPISRAKKTVGHVVHHFKAIERLPDHMDLWEQCEELMRNDDKRLIDKSAKSGKTTPDEALPSFKFYLKHKKQMDKGAITSWPAVRSLYWLMRQRAKNSRAFGTEMQGEARNDEDTVFTDIQYIVQILHHWLPFGACDPSMGKGETSDPSALLVGMYCLELKKLHVIEAVIKRRVPSKLAADLIAMQKDHNCGAWGFENNNAFEYMRTSFIDVGIEQKVHLPLAPVTATVAPEVRIDGMEPVINGFDAKILFHARLTHLLKELDNWPEPQTDHHYDGLVALQILYMIAVTRAGRGLGSIATGGRRNGTNTDGY